MVRGVATNMLQVRRADEVIGATNAQRVMDAGAVDGVGLRHVDIAWSTVPVAGRGPGRVLGFGVR